MDTREQKRAKKLYPLEFVAMCVLGIIGILFLLCSQLGAKNYIEGVFILPYKYRGVVDLLKIGENGEGNIVLAVVFFVSAFVIGKMYWKHKDIATYDEFGVRKDEKRRMEMDSKERRQLEMQSLAELEKVLPRNTIEQITHFGSEDPDKDLETLVGIQSVKDRIFEMKARMEFEESASKDKGRKNSTDQKNEGHHMVFYGNPGTGKTTVARIITGLLYEYEYIDKNICIEIDGNFLKSSDSSSTEKKVRFLCRAAYNGVLFIDEAYSLGEDKMGEIAIATLIKEMEDNRDKFVVVLAGYSEPMGKMLEKNPGFKSRVKEYLDFPDYNQSELFEIFKRMAKQKGFEVDNGCEGKLTYRFSLERSLSSWGNARTVRNVLEEAIDKHAVNFVKGLLAPNEKYVLKDVDISTEPKALI